MDTTDPRILTWHPVLVSDSSHPSVHIFREALEVFSGSLHIATGTADDTTTLAHGTALNFGSHDWILSQVVRGGTTENTGKVGHECRT